MFTTELFAHHLHIKCLSVTKCQQLNDTTNSQSSTYEAQSYVKYITDMQQPFISDVLLCKLVSGFSGQKVTYKEQPGRRQQSTKCPSELNTSDLVELLQKSAVEHLTTFRHIEARDFGSVATIVTTDFEALYAYKRGDYQQCLQLSTEIRRRIMHGYMNNDIYTFPEFIQLLDDDFVSLTALMLIVDPKYRQRRNGPCISQLILSLYLMTQCHLMLRHSVTSLHQTLVDIEALQRVLCVRTLEASMDRTTDRLILKLAERKAVAYLSQWRSTAP